MNVDAKHRTGQHQIVENVVSIANPSDLHVLGCFKMFEHRHEVCCGLAWMVLGRKGIDDRYRGVLGQFCHVLMSKTAVGDAAEEAGEDLGGVANGFGFTELDVVLKQG